MKGKRRMQKPWTYFYLWIFFGNGSNLLIMHRQYQQIALIWNSIFQYTFQWRCHGSFRSLKSRSSVDLSASNAFGSWGSCARSSMCYPYRWGVDIRKGRAAYRRPTRPYGKWIWADVPLWAIIFWVPHLSCVHFARLEWYRCVFRLNTRSSGY